MLHQSSQLLTAAAMSPHFPSQSDHSRFQRSARAGTIQSTTRRMMPMHNSTHLAALSVLSLCSMVRGDLSVVWRTGTLFEREVYDVLQVWQVWQRFDSSDGAITHRRTRRPSCPSTQPRRDNGSLCLRLVRTTCPLARGAEAAVVHLLIRGSHRAKVRRAPPVAEPSMPTDSVRCWVGGGGARIAEALPAVLSAVGASYASECSCRRWTARSTYRASSGSASSQSRPRWRRSWSSCLSYRQGLAGRSRLFAVRACPRGGC